MCMTGFRSSRTRRGVSTNLPRPKQSALPQLLVWKSGGSRATSSTSSLSSPRSVHLLSLRVRTCKGNFLVAKRLLGFGLVSCINCLFLDFPSPLRQRTLGQWLSTAAPFYLLCPSFRCSKSLHERDLLLPPHSKEARPSLHSPRAPALPCQLPEDLGTDVRTLRTLTALPAFAQQYTPPSPPRSPPTLPSVQEPHFASAWVISQKCWSPALPLVLPPGWI